MLPAAGILHSTEYRKSFMVTGNACAHELAMACTHNKFVDAMEGQSRQVQGTTCILYLKFMPGRMSTLIAMPHKIQDPVAAQEQLGLTVQQLSCWARPASIATHWHMPALHHLPLLERCQQVTEDGIRASAVLRCNGVLLHP